jgi:hypothetical protein
MSEMISDYAGDMGSIRQRMVEHPIFAAIRDIHSLRIFMRAHLSHGGARISKPVWGGVVVRLSILARSFSLLFLIIGAALLAAAIKRDRGARGTQASGASIGRPSRLVDTAGGDADRSNTR